MNILLTGPPRCGKTTVVQRVIEKLAGRRLAGFYTKEIRKGGRRLGFEAIGLGGTSATLARVDFRSRMRVGRYGVKLDGFEKLLRRELGRALDDVDLVIIDEIGRMECFSRLFVASVNKALDAPVSVLATVALKGGGFIGDVKARPDVELVPVAAVGNSDALPDEVCGLFC